MPCEKPESAPKMNLYVRRNRIAGGNPPNGIDMTGAEHLLSVCTLPLLNDSKQMRRAG